MSRRTGDRDFLDNLGPAPPPGELRGRTLGAARRAAAAPRVPAWRAVLSFFGTQPAWTAALVALVAAHLLLGFFHPGAGVRRAALPASVEEAAQPDLLRLPRILDLASQVPGPGPIRGEGDFS